MTKHLVKKLISRAGLIGRLMCLGYLPALITGCQSPPWTGFPVTTRSDLIWPPPPEPERVSYVTQIHQCEDLFKEAGGWRIVQHLIAGKPDSRMIRPHALAIHPEGGLLVSDPGKNCVHYYCWSRRRYIVIGPQRQGGLPSPIGVAALSDGRIIVSDSRLGHLESFDHDGKPLGSFGSENKFERPSGLVVDPVRRQIYVADVAAHAIFVLDFEGKLVRRFGQRGAGDVEFNFPTHLALTPEGNLVISDSLNFRVQILSPEGKFLSKFGELGDSPGHFSKLKGVSADDQGNLVTVEGLYDSLQFFTPQGQFLLNIGTSGNEPGQFWLASGLCYDPQRHLVFVADSYNRRVQVFRLLEGSIP